MGRKKREPIELVEENLEDLAAESAAENEEVENLEEELELLEADDEMEPTAVDAISDEDEDTVVMEKPKRKRAPRRKKAEAKVEVSASEETVEEEAPAVETPSREEVSAPASPAFDPKSDPMVRQWELIRQISESICSSLEKATSQIQEMPAQTAAAFQQSFKAPVSRPAPITKIAVLAAGLALVLSALSLSFAQSARQSVLAKESAPVSAARVRYGDEEPKAELPPLKVSKPASAPALELARAERPEAPAPRAERVEAPRPRPVAPHLAPPAAKKHVVAKKH